MQAISNNPGPKPTPNVFKIKFVVFSLEVVDRERLEPWGSIIYGILHSVIFNLSMAIFYFNGLGAARMLQLLRDIPEIIGGCAFTSKRDALLGLPTQTEVRKT